MTAPDHDDRNQPPLEMPSAIPAYCGNCAYDLRALTTHRCPECGARLRAAGVFRERPRHRFAMQRAFWFLLVFIPTAWILRTLVIAVLPNLYEDEQQHLFYRGDREQIYVVVAAHSGRALTWPLGTGPVEFDEAPVAIDIGAVAGRGEDDGYPPLSTNDVRASVVRTVDVKNVDELTSPAAQASLAKALEAAGLPPEQALRWASDLATAISTPFQNRYRNRVLPGARDFYPYRHSAGGRTIGGSLYANPPHGRWHAEMLNGSATTGKHPLSEAIPTVFFVLLGLGGLLMIAADVDLRPTRWRRVHPVR